MEKDYKEEVGVWIDWGRWRSFGNEPRESGKTWDLADQSSAGILGASLCCDN